MSNNFKMKVDVTHYFVCFFYRLIDSVSKWISRRYDRWNSLHGFTDRPKTYSYIINAMYAVILLGDYFNLPYYSVCVLLWNGCSII